MESLSVEKQLVVSSRENLLTTSLTGLLLGSDDSSSYTFQNFCGSEFWNDSLTWNTVESQAPEFTDCFNNTIVSWIPCGFLWLITPLYLYYLSRTNDELRQGLAFFSILKSVLSVALAGVELFYLGIHISQAQVGVKVYDAVYVSSGVTIATMLLAAALVQYYRVRGQFTSAPMFVYWGLWILGAASPLYSDIVDSYSSNAVINNKPKFSVDMIRFALVFLQFLFSCIADTNQETRERFKDTCPEFLSSFASYFTYDWLTSLVVLGYKKDLDENDLWKLGPRDQSKNHVPEFEKKWSKAINTWRREKLAVQVQAEVQAAQLNINGEDDSDTAAIIRSPPAKKKEPSLSLVGCIARQYGPLLLVAWSFKFVVDWLKFVDPQIQKQLISFVKFKMNKATSHMQPNWRGYILSVGLLISQLIQTSLFQQLWYLSVVAGMQVRASLISIIYKKALRMSPEARKESTAGEIVNLMAVDAQRVQDVSSYLWMLWSSPLQIAIALWQLYETIGVSLFAGFAVMILMMPLNGWVATKQRTLQVEQMKLKDERIKMMNEVLSGIKVIKLYAWEPSFEEKVSAIRSAEIETVRKAWYYRAVQFFGFGTLPFVVTIVTFAVYVQTQPDHVLSPEVAFVSLSLFNILRIPLNLLPMMISFIVMASVSVKRIVTFFKTTDLNEMNVERDDNCDVSLRISSGTFSWLPDNRPVLTDIDLEVATGSLTAIVGPVGCGKSSLLSAAVGDLHKTGGTVTSKGDVAFAAQQAWIQNATVRDNILFGKTYDEKKYNTVVDACALRPDFDILDNGDQTLIGEKGINLSGGQKQRVSLARACYSDADLYLLDDPLSAVDAHVGKHIFENVIGPNGWLKDKTRVLVTHGIQWLPNTDHIIVLSDGKVSECGSYDQLMTHDGAFAEFLKTYFLSVDEDEDEDGDTDQVRKAILERLSSVFEEDGVDLKEKVHGIKVQRQLSRQKSRVSEGLPGDLRTSESRMSESEKPTEPTKLQKKEQQPQEFAETVEQGSVKLDVYKYYLKSMGLIFVCLTTVQMLLYSGLNVFSSIWLSMWTNDDIFNPFTVHNYTNVQKQQAVSKYLGVYGGLGVLQTFLNLGYTLAFAHCTIRASTNIHRELLHNIMRTRMAFFDTKPLGQILNRFSKDMDVIDNVLGFNIMQLLMNSLAVIATIIVIAYSTPIFLVIVIPMCILYYFIQKFFIPTTRQLKRLESVTRSPIYTHFSETINGAQTIRAFGHQQRFMKYSEDMVEKNIVFFYAGWVANRWLAIRLEIMASFIVFLTALFCVLSTEINYLSTHITSSLVGLAITYSLNSTQSLNFLIRNISDLESNVVSVERVKEYKEVEKEAGWSVDQNAPPSDWPQRGAIEFNNYSTRYRPGLGLVLKGISFDIRPNEKIGIVGRTGAGKSSMTLSLFRLIEGTGGTISIDGVPISEIGLHQLRSKITILPQDPVLFSGTMRENLDPFEEYADHKIWEVLDQSYLKEYIEKQDEKLSHEVGEGGQNLSVGQRQLVCLARALLRKTKILVLDEATAAVDLETDDLIQQTIRTAFADCTILTIAHRLNTIIDSSRILVLDKGEIAEFDTPAKLMADPTSKFYMMATDAGLIKSD